MHTPKPVDASNPYFRFDNDLCIVCSRCVRACEDTQGTFALTIEGRGIESRVAASQQQPFLESECVSCGACVEACPTGALMEKSVITAGLPQQAVTTTCAYCGVGCSLIAEVTDGAVSRMVPEPRWPREPGPRLREGTLRVRLRDARGSRDDSR